MVLWRNGCFLLLAASALSPSFAQDPLEYLEENTEVVMTKPLSTGVGPGNGVFVFDNKVYVITDDCTVYHLDSTSLDTIWQFPSTAGTTCSSGLYFSESYMAFSAKTSSGSQIVTVGYDGTTEPFPRLSLTGTAVGTPAGTKDGRYLMSTSNSDDMTMGYFTVYDTQNPGTPVFSYNTEDFPVSALGFIHEPEAGFYVRGGNNNPNDVFMWALDNDPSNSTVGLFDGQMFAYQLPDVMNVTLVGPGRPFQTPLPPVFGNNGRNLYWSMSKSELRCWEDTTFDRGTGAPQSFDRLPGVDNASKSALVEPTLSNNEEFLVGPSAYNELFRVSADDCRDVQGLTITSGGVITSKVLVSVDDEFVYYATPMPNGENQVIFGLQASNFGGGPVFSIAADGTTGVSGHMALSALGDVLYAVDSAGTVRAIRVAEDPPTMPPTMSPTTASPTMAPTGSPTEPAPTGSPTVPPPTLSPKPTLAPVTAEPTPEPTLVTPAPTPETSGLSMGMIRVGWFMTALLMMVMM